MSGNRCDPGVGVIVPAVTPLLRDGNVDHESLERVVGNCLDAGVSGIFVLGSAGEGVCLDWEQKQQVIRTAKRLTGGRVPLYAGALEPGTRRVKDGIRLAQDSGADVVVVTPHYYLRSANQDEIVRHLELCAAVASVPVLAYNNPGTVYVNMAPATVAKVMAIDNVIGLKESTRDWEQFQAELTLTEGTDFRLIIGGQPILGRALLAGADGCISGVGNYAPQLITRIHAEAGRGNTEAVQELQDAVMRLDEATHAGDFFLAGIKYACSLLGLCEEHLSEPFQVLTEPQKQIVERGLSKEGLL